MNMLARNVCKPIKKKASEKCILFSTFQTIPSKKHTYNAHFARVGREKKHKKETKRTTFIDFDGNEATKKTHICRDNINVTINMIGTTHNNDILFVFPSFRISKNGCREYYLQIVSQLRKHFYEFRIREKSTWNTFISIES